MEILIEHSEFTAHTETAPVLEKSPEKLQSKPVRVPEQKSLEVSSNLLDNPDKTLNKSETAVEEEYKSMLKTAEKLDPPAEKTNYDPTEFYNEMFHLAKNGDILPLRCIKMTLLIMLLTLQLMNLLIRDKKDANSQFASKRQELSESFAIKVQILKIKITIVNAAIASAKQDVAREKLLLAHANSLLGTNKTQPAKEITLRRDTNDATSKRSTISRLLQPTMHTRRNELAPIQ